MISETHPRATRGWMLRVGTYAAIVAGVLSFVGCTTAATQTKGKEPTRDSQAPSLAPSLAPGQRPEIVHSDSKKKVKIAIIAIQNNPFFDQVRQGFDAVKPKLDAVGAQVDWLNAGTEVTVDSVGRAMSAAVAQKYDGIAALMPGDGICAYIRQAARAGVVVAAYGGDASCAQKSGSIFFHGQDTEQAGVEAGKLMCQGTKDLASQAHPGKVGILTESFSFQALENRRKGFVTSLKENCPWVTPVNDGVEYQASTDRVASATRDFMTAVKNLVAIYVTGGNPHVAALTVGQAGKADRVKVVGFDFTNENVKQIKDGNMYASIGQDPFGQSYDTVVWLYNAIITGNKPTPQYFVPTKAVVGTHDNINEVTSPSK
jgi:ribose transport system substrate-binding protein